MNIEIRVKIGHTEIRLTPVSFDGDVQETLAVWPTYHEPFHIYDWTMHKLNAAAVSVQSGDNAKEIEAQFISELGFEPIRL